MDRVHQNIWTGSMDPLSWTGSMDPLFLYARQLSRIMRESHACGPKIAISRIQANFVRLTANSECNCLKTDEIKKNSIFFFRRKEYLPNSLTILQIGWKSLGNRWPCFEVVKNLSTPSVIFGSQREIFGNLQKLSENLQRSSEIFGDFWKSSEIFGNRRKPSVNLQKFRFYGDE